MVTTINTTKAGRRIVGGSWESACTSSWNRRFLVKQPDGITAFGGSLPLAELNMKSCKATEGLSSPPLSSPAAERQGGYTVSSTCVLICVCLFFLLLRMTIIPLSVGKFLVFQHSTQMSQCVKSLQVTSCHRFSHFLSHIPTASVRTSFFIPKHWMRFDYIENGNVSFSNCWLLVGRNTIDLCMSSLYPPTLPNSLNCTSDYFCRSRRVFHGNSHVVCK